MKISNEILAVILGFVLATFVSLQGWTLSEINKLDVRVARMEQTLADLTANRNIKPVSLSNEAKHQKSANRSGSIQF